MSIKICQKNYFVKPLLILFMLMLFLPAACSNEQKITKTIVGQNFSADGKTTNTNLIFQFHTKDTFNKNKDFFNFVYFEGDTVCFSYKLAQAITKEQLKIYFINPKTNARFAAERIDIINNNLVTGFSLVGSILEQFFGDRLEQSFQEKAFINADIPFIVSIEISADAEKQTAEIMQNTETSFKITLLNE